MKEYPPRPRVRLRTLPRVRRRSLPRPRRTLPRPRLTFCARRRQSGMCMSRRTLPRPRLVLRAETPVRDVYARFRVRVSPRRRLRAFRVRVSRRRRVPRPRSIVVFRVCRRARLRLPARRALRRRALPRGSSRRLPQTHLFSRAFHPRRQQRAHRAHGGVIGIFKVVRAHFPPPVARSCVRRMYSTASAISG